MEEDELTVGDLVEQLPVSQPRVSIHLGCLTDCGFTSVRREGRHAFYRVSSPWAMSVISLMRDHAEEHCDELLACAGCAPQGRPGSDASKDPPRAASE